MKKIGWMSLIILSFMFVFLFQALLEEQQNYERIERDLINATEWRTKLGNPWIHSKEILRFSTKFVPRHDMSQGNISGFVSTFASILSKFLDTFIGEREYLNYLQQEEPENWWEIGGNILKEAAVSSIVDTYDYDRAIDEAKEPFSKRLYQDQNKFDINILSFIEDIVRKFYGDPRAVEQHLIHMGQQYGVLYTGIPIQYLTDLGTRIETARKASNYHVKVIGALLCLVIMAMTMLVWWLARTSRTALVFPVLWATPLLWSGITESLSSHMMMLEQGTLSIPSIEYSFSIEQQTLSYTASSMWDIINKKLHDVPEDPLLLVLLLVTSLGLILVPIYQLTKMSIYVCTKRLYTTPLDTLLSWKWVDLMLFYYFIRVGFELYESSKTSTYTPSFTFNAMTMHVDLDVSTIATLQAGFVAFILFGIISFTLRRYELRITKTLVNNE